MHHKAKPFTDAQVADLLKWHATWSTTPSLNAKARELGSHPRTLLDTIARAKGDLTCYQREKLKALG